MPWWVFTYAAATSTSDAAPMIDFKIDASMQKGVLIKVRYFSKDRSNCGIFPKKW